MEFVSELKEISYESSFKWKINNLSVASAKKNYVIKSNEVDFKEANAKWFVKIKQFISESGIIWLDITFYLRDDGKDDNARYNFAVKTIKGTSHDNDLVDSGPFISKNQTNKRSLLERNMGKYIPIGVGCENIEIEPICTMETLKHEVEVEAEEKVDEDEGWEKCETATSDESPSSESDKSSDDESTSSGSKLTTSESDDDVFFPETKPENLNVMKRIQNIYLVKMEQIAETSARLLVTAARNGFAQLLTETSNSFAAQMTPENFTEIWDIARELKAEPLKKAVVDYVVTNRERITYNPKMTSELMLEVVKAT
jgi:hypothetical protein